MITINLTEYLFFSANTFGIQSGLPADIDQTEKSSNFFTIFGLHIRSSLIIMLTPFSFHHGSMLVKCAVLIHISHNFSSGINHDNEPNHQ